jgi:prepilin-type N-terminal cleavage/methylation domain-containing protein
MMTKRLTKSAAEGFTLIEILVTIAIIVLLVAIVIPSVRHVQKVVGHGRSQGIINLLDGACQMYFQDFKVYPDSTPMIDPDPAKCYGGKKMYGRHRLVVALTGYLTAADAPSGRGDGANGYGFRVPVSPGSATFGKIVYGPYNGAEKLAMKADESSFDEPLAFFDTFGYPIFYYRFDEANKRYNAADNADVADDARCKSVPNNHMFKDEGIPNANPMRARNASGTYDRSFYECLDNTSVPEKYFQQTFLLMSAGPDRSFTAWQADHETDDITNFLPGAK